MVQSGNRGSTMASGLRIAQDPSQGLCTLGVDDLQPSATPVSGRGTAAPGSLKRESDPTVLHEQVASPYAELGLARLCALRKPLWGRAGELPDGGGRALDEEHFLVPGPPAVEQ